MENLAPPLALLLSVKRALIQGLPVKFGVEEYIKNESSNNFAVITWYNLIKMDRDLANVYKSEKTTSRRVTLQLIEKGLRGEAIYSSLCQLERELIDMSYAEINSFSQKLPFTTLIPLLLLQFPALLILLFGPLLQNLFHSLQMQ